MNRTFFIDFDGTITKEDTCYSMVKAFAKDGWEDINRLWEEKKISTAECAERTFKLFDASIEDIGKLMDTAEIDGYFKKFLSLCSSNGFEVYVLSDGYNFNIERILKNNDISVGFYSNKLLYDNDKGFTIETPFKNDSCDKCGTCKLALMEKLKRGDSQIIYIGDGFSDTCPAKHADKVYAKYQLFRYCMENNIASVYFSSFRDIISNEFGWEV